MPVKDGLQPGATILVTGGAGYIGSHVCKALAAAGYRPVTFDDLSGGHAWAVRWGPLVQGCLTDPDALDAAFAGHRPAAVIHLAGLIAVAESVREPARYHRINVDGTRCLLGAMQRHAVRHIVFSSSAAVYGEPETTPLTEAHPLQPISPYGRNKVEAESLLAAAGIEATSLRYFNAAGADPDGEIGEAHPEETHLVPLVLEAAAGRRPHVAVYGTDYPTRDGSCLRDYVHVSDLADAHLLALERRADGPGLRCINLGSGTGATVFEVLACAERLTGRRIPKQIEARRPGDPAMLLADPSLAGRLLGWHPARSGLDSIVASAWRWLCDGQRAVAGSQAAAGS